MPPCKHHATSKKTACYRYSDASSQVLGPDCFKIHRLRAGASSARGVLPAAMDIFASNAYLSDMFARVLSMLAIISIAVVTTISAAHAARMDGKHADHALHPAGMMHATTHAYPSCEGSQHCGSADAAMCEFVCAGLSVFLTMPGVEAADAYGPGSHDLPSEATHFSRAPGLNERPPKLRLL